MLFNEYKPLQDFGTFKSKPSLWEWASAGFNLQAQLENAGKKQDILRFEEYERFKKVQKVLGQNIKPTRNIIMGDAVSQLPKWFPHLPDFGNAIQGPFGTPMLGSIASNIEYNKSEDEKLQSQKEFENQIEEARAANPSVFEGIETYDQFRNKVAVKIGEKRKQFDEIIEATDNPFVVRMVGGVLGSFVDPVNLFASIATGGAAKGAPVIKAAIQGAGANIVAEAANIPMRYWETNQIEKQKYGLGNVAFDLGAAAVFGAAFEIGGRAIGGAVKKVKGKAQKPNIEALKIDETPNETNIVQAAKKENFVARAERIEALEEPEVKGMAIEASKQIENAVILDELDFEESQLIEQEMHINELRAKIGEPLKITPIGQNAPKNLDEVFDESIIKSESIRSENIRFFSEKDNQVEINSKIFQENAVGGNVDDLGAQNVGQQSFGEIFNSQEYRGRIIHQGRFDPTEIETAPKIFQYKDGGDLNGVTDRLKGVQKWDVLSSGKSVIWEDWNGARFIADGHQRRGLAKRLKNEGDDAALLDGYLFRQADGWEANEVKIIAAEKNIREGSGDPIDAAKVFREAKGSVDFNSLPMSGGVAREGVALSKLSDDAFGSIINKAFDKADGVIVGEMAQALPELHLPLLDEIKKGKYTTIGEKRLMVGKLLSEHWTNKNGGAQGEMFNVKMLVPDLFHEKNKALNAAMREIRKNEAAFNSLVKNSNALQNVGNVIAHSASEKEAQALHAAMQVVWEGADRIPEIQNALIDAARAIKDGKKPGDVINNLVEKVLEQTRRKTPIQILNEAQAPKPEDIEVMAKIADDPYRFENLGEEIVPFEKDELTGDMFGDLSKDAKAVDLAEKDIQAISICMPKG